MEQYFRALIGPSEYIEAEFGYKPLDGSPFCFAEMVDDEIICVGGYNTLYAAKKAAIDYGFKLNQLEIYGK